MAFEREVNQAVASVLGNQAAPAVPSAQFGEPTAPREYYDDIMETYDIHMGARNIIFPGLGKPDFSTYREQYEWGKMVKANEDWGKKQEGNIRNIRRWRGW